MASAPEPTQKRLERACLYVDDLFIPADPVMLSRLQGALKSCHQVAPVVEIIEQDLGLFWYALRGLLKLMRDHGVKLPEHSSPQELMRKAGIEALRELFDGKDLVVSRHFFDGMTENQAKRMEEAITSASAAQLLAPTYGIQAEEGYSAALMRQFGLILIAWNYPGVYQRCFAEIRDGFSLEDALAKALGFSPQLLAMSLLERWGMTRKSFTVFNVSQETSSVDGEDDEVHQTFFADDGDESLSIDALELGAPIQELCAVAEALARANQPELYPTARADWQAVKHEIEERLGNNGLQEIQGALKERFEHYLVAIPQIVTAGQIVELEGRLQSYEQSRLDYNNPWAKKCPQDLAAALGICYRAIEERKSGAEVLRTWKDSVSASMFLCGCVYTADPSQQHLMPQLWIKMKQVHRSTLPVSLVLGAKGSDPVTLAFHSDETIEHYVKRDGREPHVALAAYVGYMRKLGVLYLETPAITISSQQRDLEFRAIRKALTDSLHEAVKLA